MDALANQLQHMCLVPRMEAVYDLATTGIVEAVRDALGLGAGCVSVPVSSDDLHSTLVVPAGDDHGLLFGKRVARSCYNRMRYEIPLHDRSELRDEILEAARQGDLPIHWIPPPQGPSTPGVGVNWPFEGEVDASFVFAEACAPNRIETSEGSFTLTESDEPEMDLDDTETVCDETPAMDYVVVHPGATPQECLLRSEESERLIEAHVSTSRWLLEGHADDPAWRAVLAHAVAYDAFKVLEPLVHRPTCRAFFAWCDRVSGRPRAPVVPASGCVLGILCERYTLSQLVDILGGLAA